MGCYDWLGIALFNQSLESWTLHTDKKTRKAQNLSDNDGQAQWSQLLTREDLL